MKNKIIKGIFIILLIFSISIIFFYLNQQNNIDIKYINDKSYCEQNNECVWQGDFCGSMVNIYNYKESSIECGLPGIGTPICVNNNCENQLIYEMENSEIKNNK